MQEYPTYPAMKMEKTHRLSEMERGVRELLSTGQAVWIPDNEMNMSVFAEYPKEKEGIAVYYPIYKDGSCAEAMYIRFYRSASGMSIDRASVREYAEQEKARLDSLLRIN